MPASNDPADIPISDGDMYPNDGDSFQAGIYYPEAPKEQTEAIAAESAAASVSFPIMAEVLDWFNRQVEKAGDINQIETKRLTINGVTYGRTVSIEAQVLAQQLLKEMLAEKAHEWERFSEEQDD